MTMIRDVLKLLHYDAEWFSPLLRMPVLRPVKNFTVNYSRAE